MHKLLSVFSMNEIHGEMNAPSLTGLLKLEPICFTGISFVSIKPVLSFFSFIYFFLLLKVHSAGCGVRVKSLLCIYIDVYFLKGSGGSKYSYLLNLWFICLSFQEERKGKELHEEGPPSLQTVYVSHHHCL